MIALELAWDQYVSLGVIAGYVWLLFWMAFSKREL